jgi:hypothetical protein
MPKRRPPTSIMLASQSMMKTERGKPSSWAKSAKAANASVLSVVAFSSPTRSLAPV